MLLGFKFYEQVFGFWQPAAKVYDLFFIFHAEIEG
jgi:hypothetical protein